MIRLHVLNILKGRGHMTEPQDEPTEVSPDQEQLPDTEPEPEPELEPDQ